jgi:hypothetical protein
MMYILTDDEMQAKWANEKRIAGLPTHEELKNVCRIIATTMIPTKHTPGHNNANEYTLTHPHGCVDVRAPDTGKLTAHYCDNCPVRGICPMPKELSK